MGAVVMDLAAASELVRSLDLGRALELVLALELGRAFALTIVSEAMVSEAGDSAADLEEEVSVAAAEEDSVTVIE